ncbi:MULTISPECIES: lytic transglycosylase domain-containing protein [Burkholderia]|jgi:soluble lytic murein transglycosylase-like protein|uniref:Lytic transglycosylase n=4 Tax=Burkholderia cepacia complex TaxID=87882 RepID=A0A6P2S7J8_BURL3|nr:lytic transglycosylase domain-containing protein [Burkholderia contaminans]VWC39976.1 lytic transglycosylase [Burkholderia lata]HBN6128644.1 lytic transglycosylase domain-containing protein [Clostridioides difficile]QDS32442.1 lytic transglycosylase domain-containing protein [Burkholderia contaminans]QGW75083.1 transglycosylase SLT domain-containing protein [Burkholderia contaminans]RBQ57699.1 lytic transglycosylase [Burkholderia contaminans]
MKDRLNDRLLRAAVMTIGMGMLWATSLPAARADCLDDAANYWSVPTSLARAVAMQESGMRPRVVSKNTNGSRDIGLMQINSSWLPRLKQYGIGEEDLLDACKNAYVGTWIMAQNIAQLGYNWTAIGAYNAVTPSKRDAYARKIYGQLMRLQGGATTTGPMANQ